MDSDIWLPLATLVLGWAGAQVTEVFRDRRTSTRDRLARRAELQRPTLLELQETLGDLLGAVAVQIGLDAAMLKEGEHEQPPWKDMADLVRKLGASRGRVELLASRVEDERVRELSVALVKASEVISAEDAWDPERNTSFRDFQADYSEAVARIGELLRERY